MVAAVPLVDEFVEDIWYDEPATSVPESAEEDHNSGAADRRPGRRGRKRVGDTTTSPAHFL
ncbi:MAG: hypothetical protein GEU94_13355 [Micromonosporaceae bacterium]|nr:hypothetical protein [Micromonosporaceae bacterium]